MKYLDILCRLVIFVIKDHFLYDYCSEIKLVKKIFKISLTIPRDDSDRPVNLKISPSYGLYIRKKAVRLFKNVRLYVAFRMNPVVRIFLSLHTSAVRVYKV